jgi:hypothetical protein
MKRGLQNSLGRTMQAADITRLRFVARLAGRKSDSLPARLTFSPIFYGEAAEFPAAGVESAVSVCREGAAIDLLDERQARPRRSQSRAADISNPARELGSLSLRTLVRRSG